MTEEKRDRKSIWVWGLITAIAASLAVWGSFGPGSEKSPGEEEGVKKTTVASYAGDTCALIYIAGAEGYFAQNGLDVEIDNYEAGSLAFDALMKGKADIAVAAEFDFVNSSFDNPDLRIIGTVSSTLNKELVARRDKGISRIQHLKGKKIGVTATSEGDFTLERFLTFNDLSFKDIEVVNLTPRGIAEAIESGEIDAGLTWEPHIYHIKSRLGERAISWLAQNGQYTDFIVAAQVHWIKGHTETVSRFMKAVILAEKFAGDDPGRTKAFITNRFNYKEEYTDYFLPKINFAVKLPQFLIITLEDQARWRIRHKLTDKTEVPNYLDYIYFDAMEEVKPGAITIIHGLVSIHKDR